MERVSAADASFLYLESDTVHLHVTGLLVLDPSTAPKGLSFKQLRRHIAGRIDLLPTLRRRLIEVPWAIDHPEWAEDPDFDLDEHVHHHVLTGSEPRQELADFVGAFASVRLDRSRPLWDFVVIEGLDDGHVAVAMKMHHCMVDGVSGMDIMVHLLDLAPKSKTRRRPPPWEPESLPVPSDVVSNAIWNRVTTPTRPFRAAASAVTSLTQAAGTVVGRWVRGAKAVAHPLNAPRTRLNGSISANRTVAFTGVPLADLKTVRRAFGTTVNDVVLAVCTYGLRSYLQTHDHVPDRPLVCSVPVSVHGKGGDGASTNQVSNMFVHLPVHVADPVDQLRLIHEGTEGAKEVQSAVGATMIGDFIELMPPTLFGYLSRLYSQAGIADRLPPVHNLIVSNVPGSPVPLYFAGAEVVGVYPFGPLMEGTGLNITVLSSDQDMHFGLIACPELVPHLGFLLEAMLEGLAKLLAAAS